MVIEITQDIGKKIMTSLKIKGNENSKELIHEVKDASE